MPSAASSASKRPDPGWRSRLAIAAMLAALGAGAAAVIAPSFLGWVGLDLMFALRHAVTGPLFPPAESDVAVVVLDEETYGREPYLGTPQVAWTPHLARVIEAIDAAAPKAIGLDIIYPTTLDQPHLLPEFDKPLLKAFLKSGRAGRLVLGQVRLSQQVIAPHRRQVIAAGGADNLRTLNLLMDPDEVVRRYPAAFANEGGGTDLSFGMELARRAGAAVPADDFLVNFNTGPEDLPLFTLADMVACAEAGRSDFFARHFAGKVVLIGMDLDLEDRRSTAKRFTTGLANASGRPRCVLAADDARFGQIVNRRTIPGVMIHAAAINTITKGLALKTLPPTVAAAAVGATTLMLALVLFVLPPLLGVLFTAVLSAGVMAAALALFMGGNVVPIAAFGLAAAVTYVVVYAYRVVVEDKAKRWIQHAFRHFLAPHLVDQLASDPGLLALGGERRRITVAFLDVAGFTTLSEVLRDRPETLVEVMNRVFTEITGCIEATGGYVDKFIGDAVMAVWGAPVADDEAEIHAVAAALACIDAVNTLNRDVIGPEYGLPPIDIRIGINSGNAIVGNMGSATRLNYTATGDAVNLASRLEGANKQYGTRLMISEDTARRLNKRFLLRRLDRLVVKGKSLPVRVYEVIGPREAAAPVAAERVKRFHAAMAAYYRRGFAAAADAFAAIAAAGDPVAEVYARRCRHFLEAPPPPRWDRTYILDSK